MSERAFWDSHEKSLDVGRETACVPMHPLCGDITRFVGRRLGEKGRLRLLEAGCGSGRWNFHLASVFGNRLQTVGVDFSNLVFSAARHGRETGVRSVQFSKGEIERLPFRDGAFDVILCLGVLEHFNPPDGVLAELKRVLASDGRIYLETPRAFHADAHDHDAELEIDYTLPQLVRTLRSSRMGVEAAYTRGFHFRLFYVANYLRKRLGLGRPGGLLYRLLGKAQRLLKPLNLVGDPAGWGFYNVVIVTQEAAG